jgi:DNA-binding transcriptional MerR regulator
MASEAFTLAQLARAVGMSVDQVRFYKDRGLLPPPRRRRSRSDDHGFLEEHLDRLRFIQRAIAYGYSVENIAEFVNEQGLVTCNDVYRISLARLDELRSAFGSKDPMVKTLEKLIGSCSTKGGRNDCEILIALEKPDQLQTASR